VLFVYRALCGGGGGSLLYTPVNKFVLGGVEQVRVIHFPMVLLSKFGVRIVQICVLYSNFFGSYSTLGPVSTGMVDRLRMSQPSQYVIKTPKSTQPGHPL